jgi:hypothetical protein
MTQQQGVRGAIVVVARVLKRVPSAAQFLSR